ncbi:MAG: radical SAM protein [archaeon YNP-WB-040]|nr:radical SAM protein [Candidatus Culexarchaeum yellowstonense]
METLAFGPVPSRRLGRSLGVNNIPPKTCSYSCVYCQLGRTSNMTIDRKAFYRPEDILMQVERKVNEAKLRGERVDYITFVPDGEPTLDVNLGREISLLKHVGLPIAVITNASLLWREDVREDLSAADFVSLKVDAVSVDLWRHINRPHKSLKLNAILDGIEEFAKKFNGIIVSETMLIDGVNYGDELERIADFLRSLAKLNKAYIAIPTRPPAEKWVKPAKEETINVAFQTFVKKLGNDKVEYLIGYEGNAFAFTGNVKEDLLSITAVHPMREEAVAELLRKANASWHIVDELLRSGELVRLEYEGNIYYMRKLIKNR